MDTLTSLRENLGKLSDSDRAFATSLLEQSVTRGLSPQQTNWVDKLVRRAASPKLEPVNLTKLAHWLSFNSLSVKRPQVAVRAGELDIRLSVAGPNSRTPGHINVTSTDRAYEERTFYGRIGRDGEFSPSLALEPDTLAAIVRALRALETDPAATAAAYGRATGCCSFCRLPLVDARSVAAGYGRTCARKYGLPYGEAVAA